MLGSASTRCRTHNPPDVDCARPDAPYRPGEVALLLHPGRTDPSGFDDAAPWLQEACRIDTHNADVHAVLDHLAGLPWRDPEHVQVLMRSQDSNLYALSVLRDGALVHVPQPGTTESVSDRVWTLTLDQQAEASQPPPAQAERPRAVTITVVKAWLTDGMPEGLTADHFAVARTVLGTGADAQVGRETMRLMRGEWGRYVRISGLHHDLSGWTALALRRASSAPATGSASSR